LQDIIEWFRLGQVPAIALPVVGPILHAYISHIVHHRDAITATSGDRSVHARHATREP
jgi:hypothetical protein